MKLIQQITNESAQTQTFNLDDGTSFTMSMYYAPMQYGWFISSLTYLSFTLNGLRITNSPDMLYQFKNQLTFGLACFSKNSIEPTQQDSFSSGLSNLYILSSTEVASYSEYLSGKST